VNVTVSASAQAVVRRVAAEGRRDLVLVLGTGCCDSTAPFLYDSYYPGPDAVPVGEIDGVPVYAHRWLAALYGEDEGLEIDVEQSVANDSFSLESDYDCRFVLRLAGARKGAAPAG
jgi:uncharacterized protein (DUF779 family)